MAIQAAAEPGARDQPAGQRNPFVGAGYRWWWGTTFAASVAIGLQLVTVPTYVLDRTDTRFYVALALLCQTVPTPLLTLLVGLSPSLPLAAVLLLFSGLGAAVFINYASTLLQTYTDPRMIGRVMSLWGLAFMAAVPLGNLQAGIGLQLSDPRVVLVYSGAASIALGLLAFGTLRAARELE